MRRKFMRKNILRLAGGMRQEPRSATLGPKEEISELQINGQQGGANRRETDEKSVTWKWEMMRTKVKRKSICGLEPDHPRYEHLGE